MIGGYPIISFSWEPIYGEPGKLIVGYDVLDESLDVLRADPRIWIRAETMERLRNGQHHSDLSLVDDVLTVRSANRTVVYRIHHYLPEPDCWYAEWPD